MVRVTDYQIRKNASGEAFCVLVVTGNLEAVKSKKTNKLYFTVLKATVPASFSEAIAKTMIGQQISGTVRKVPCEPYVYITDSEEAIELDFQYEFCQDSDNVVETVLG